MSLCIMPLKAEDSSPADQNRQHPGLRDMKLRATPAFTPFAKSAAEECKADTTTILYLSYAYVEATSNKGYKWVLNVVNRADFPSTPIMIVNDWEVLYEPDCHDQLNNSILDFRESHIVVRSNKPGRE